MATAGLSRCCHRHQLSATEAVHAGRGSVTRQPRPVKGAKPILRFSDKVPAPRHLLSQIRDPNMERLAGTYQPTHLPACLPAFLTFQSRQIPNTFSAYSWQLTLHPTCLHPLHIARSSRPAPPSNGRLASSWLRPPPGPTVQAG